VSGEELQQRITNAIQAYRDEIDRTRREINEVESLLRQNMAEVVGDARNLNRQPGT